MTTNAPLKKIPLKMPSIAPSPKPPTMNDGKKRLTKYQFKVCEAVQKILSSIANTQNIPKE